VKVPEAAKVPETPWVSLDRWSAARGFAPARKVLQAPINAYAFSSTNGTLVVQVGMLTAYWDRMEIRLGFPPRIGGDQVLVHSLDLKKNIEPLVRGMSASVVRSGVIVIDPGHGGYNYGTRSVADARWEKDFTLDWARRLAPLLETNGWQVRLTRNSDVEVSLQDRVAIADTHQADFFLSLHFNSPGGTGTGGETAGLETYCLTPVGMTSTLKRNFPDDPTQFFPNNAFDEQNLQFAARLHRSMLAANGDVDRGIRRARFLTVLQGQRRPAVLIEGGYLSNPREAQRIGEPAYRQLLAEAVARALNGIIPRTNTPPEKNSVPVVVASRSVQTNQLKADISALQSGSETLRPDASKLKDEPETSEGSETNALRLMKAQPVRLHSPRNVP
jgi:N-acetylmuramoyl-L-alanine amidase